MKAEKILLAVLSLALLVSACGGSGDSCGPCNTPPADYCADANTLLVHPAAGVDPANASIYNAVSQAVARAVIYEDHGTAHPNSHGLNVYFPCYYYPWDEYQDVTWAQDTGWDDLVLAH
jgi:hypothetical protein